MGHGGRWPFVARLPRLSYPQLVTVCISLKTQHTNTLVKEAGMQYH